MDSEHAPFVTVLEPPEYRDRTVRLGEDDLLVGRAPSCDLRFEDPYLSRLHAKLERRGGRVFVRDLGSSGGTFVNDDQVETVSELHDGDVVTLGSVSLRLTADVASGTQVLPAVDGRRAATTRPAPVVYSARYDVRDQHAGTLNNVARDQYNHYVQQRESFLREVAATKTRARWLVWTGLVIFALGFGTQLVGALGYANSITDILGAGSSGRATAGPPPLDTGGFRLAFIGAAAAAVGAVLLVVGIVLHVVAASRRRRVDRDMPLQPWPGHS